MYALTTQNGQSASEKADQRRAKLISIRFARHALSRKLSRFTEDRETFPRIPGLDPVVPGGTAELIRDSGGCPGDNIKIETALGIC